MTDSKDLKILALKEVISRDKVQYEDQIADLRVELTQVNVRAEEVANENVALRQEIDTLAAASQGDVVEGVVVSEEAEKPTARTKKSTK